MNYKLLILKLSYIFYYKIFTKVVYYILQRFYNIFFFLSKSQILIFFTILKYNSLFQFNFLIEGTSIDFIQKKKRFFLKYFLLSTFFNLRAVITLKLNEFSFIFSLKQIFYSAQPIEREI